MTVVFEDLLPGEYVLKLTGMAPYADVTATIRVGADELFMQPVVASIIQPAAGALPEQFDTKASGTTSLVSAPVSGAGSQSLLVTSLPNTGAPSGPGSLQPFLLMLATTGLLVTGGFALRHKRT